MLLPESLRRYPASEQRAFFALLTATIGVHLCILEGHFEIDHFNQSHLLLEHRCGLCLLVALVWLLAEFLNILRHAYSRAGNI